MALPSTVLWFPLTEQQHMCLMFVFFSDSPFPLLPSICIQLLVVVLCLFILLLLCHIPTVFSFLIYTYGRRKRNVATLSPSFSQ